MTFLNPALLFGLLAAVIPILIHLFNKRKLEKIEFSTLKFLKELQKTKIKKIKLKQWLLLLLRTLIIIFLVGAFSRPAIKSVSAAGAASSAKSSGVFIIDDTPSMGIVGSNGTYFSKALHIAKETLDNYQDGDEIEIIKLSSPERSVKFTSPTAASNYLDNITPSNAESNFSSAINTALSFLEASPNINKEIYLFSDLQKTSAVISDSIKGDAGKNNNINFYLADINKNDIKNNSLLNIKLSNQIFELNKEIKFTLTAAGEQGESVVSVFINGIRSAQKRINFSKGLVVNNSFKITLTQTGLLGIKAELEDDSFNYDNSTYEAIFVPPQINAAIFYSSLSEIEFLKLALLPESNKTLNLKVINWNQINSINLNNFDVLILTDIKQSPNNRKIVDFVESGKGIIIFPTNGTSIEGYNQLAQLLNLPKAEKIIESKEPQSINGFDKIDFEHLIFDNLFGEKKKNIPSPEIYKYVKFNNKSIMRRIIGLKDGSFFLAEKINKGKIILFNTFPALNWSSFPLSGLFAPLLYRSVVYSAQPLLKERKYIVGQSIPVNVSQVSIPILEIVTPKNENEKVDLTKQSGRIFLYKNTFTPGIYKFMNEGKLIDFAVVNPVTSESKINYFENDEFISKLEEAGYKFNFIVLNEKDNPDEIISQARFGIELWKYLLIAAFVLAVIEMLVARNSKKEIMSFNND